MENNNGIEGYIKRKNEENEVQWIEHAMLGVCKERLAAELIGIPERETAMFDALNPEESRGDEIRTQVPFYKKESFQFREERFFKKKVIEEEQG